MNEVVAWAAKQYGTVDILVNAVGGSTIIERPNATLDELSFDDWQKLIAFNLSGTFLFCHAVIPLMKRRKSGKIVNLASIAGRGLSVASSGAYATAKGGIIALTQEALAGTRAVRHQRQRHCAEPDPDRAHQAALQSAIAGRSGC